MRRKPNFIIILVDDLSPDVFHAETDLVHDFGVQRSEPTIDLQVAIVPIWPVADELVGAKKASEAGPISAARRHIWPLVDDEPADIGQAQ